MLIFSNTVKQTMLTSWSSTIKERKTPMSPKSFYRCSILFILCSCCVLVLTSCTTSTTTATSVTPRKALLLKDMGNGVCRQVPYHVMWQTEKSQKFSTWNEADEYVKSLQLGGYNDWRLPTLEELLFLSELLEMKKGTCSITFKNAHWVNSKDKNRAGYWGTDSLCSGSDFQWLKGEEGYVRAIRP